MRLIGLLQLVISFNNLNSQAYSLAMPTKDNKQVKGWKQRQIYQYAEADLLSQILCHIVCLTIKILTHH